MISMQLVGLWTTFVGNTFNFGIDPTQNGQMAKNFDFCYNLFYMKSIRDKSRFRSPNGRCLVYQATPTPCP